MKKEYNQPQFEFTVVALGQFLCNSPGGGTDNGNGETGGDITGAPARTLYV